jgi:ribosomal protein S18 acetylase RimI-like enzyme
MSVVEGLPAGFVARPATLADAVPVAGLIAESSRAAVGEDDVTVDEVRERLQQSELDPPRYTVLVSDEGARPVGFAQLEDEPPEQADVDVYVHPGLGDDVYHRLGRWLALSVLGRLEAVCVESGRSGVRVAAGCYRAETRLVEVLRAAGFAHHRVFWRMRIELTDGGVPVAWLPPSVTIRRVDVSEPAELQVVHRLDTETFREHVGVVEHSFEEFLRHTVDRVHFDPLLWWVAESQGRAVGFLMADNRRADVGGGWVRALGVLREFRGRGVGRALLAEAFAEFRRRGLSHAMLAVDSQNSTGATALYESVGMAQAAVVDWYTVTVPRTT